MITFPIPNHVILFGGSPLLIAVANMLRRRKIAVDVFTAPRQVEEAIGENGETLGQMLTKQGLGGYVVTNDIAKDFPLVLIGSNTLGIGLGEAWPFPKEMIDLFAGRLLDFMGIPLPRYRGAAHYSWAIMNRETHWGCALQEVTVNTLQGVRDDGRLICEGQYEVEDFNLIPEHWFETCVATETKFIERFLDGIEQGAAFIPKLPDEKRSLFFPRLKTAEQGWVDWRWSSGQICDFISAFDKPYQGASTTINGRVVQVRAASCGDSNETYHPFASGLILNVFCNEIQVATHDGAIFIYEVMLEGRNILPELRPGMRFVTTQGQLEHALSYQPNYTPLGDKPAKESHDHMIIGKKVMLKTLIEADVTEAYVKGLNDPDVNKYLECRYDMHTMESVRRYVREMERSECEYLFGIYENNCHVGNIKIGQINRRHGFADLGYVIFRKDRWGNGLATEAIQLAAEFAFDELHLHRLHAGCYETHVASMKTLRKAGFSFDCIWNHQLIRDGKREGHAFYSLLKDAYEAAHC